MGPRPRVRMGFEVSASSARGVFEPMAGTAGRHHRPCIRRACDSISAIARSPRPDPPRGYRALRHFVDFLRHAGVIRSKKVAPRPQSPVEREADAFETSQCPLIRSVYAREEACPVMHPRRPARSTQPAPFFDRLSPVGAPFRRFTHRNACAGLTMIANGGRLAIAAGHSHAARRW
jgi:hypothetical protein